MVLSLALAYMLSADWPASGLWAVGFLVGIKLIFAGMSIVMVGGAQAVVADAIDQA